VLTLNSLSRQLIRIACLKQRQLGVPVNWQLDTARADYEALMSGAPWSVQCGKNTKIVSNELMDIYNRLHKEPTPTTFVELSVPEAQWQTKALSEKELVSETVSRLRRDSAHSPDPMNRAFQPHMWREWREETRRLRAGFLRWRKNRSWTLNNPDCMIDSSSEVKQRLNPRQMWNTQVSLFVPPYHTKERLELAEALEDALLGIASPGSFASRLDTGEACGQSEPCVSVTDKDFCPLSIDPKGKPSIYWTEAQPSMYWTEAQPRSHDWRGAV
jgi:hypothetical protein